MNVSMPILFFLLIAHSLSCERPQDEELRANGENQSLTQLILSNEWRMHIPTASLYLAEGIKVSFEASGRFHIENVGNKAYEKWLATDSTMVVYGNYSREPFKGYCQIYQYDPVDSVFISLKKNDFLMPGYPLRFIGLKGFDLMAYVQQERWRGKRMMNLADARQEFPVCAE